MSRVVITPTIHWVHHHARRVDTDSNYGTIFSFWDPILGTRSAKQRDLAMPIGTEGRAEESRKSRRKAEAGGASLPAYLKREAESAGDAVLPCY
ncbi:MAG: sterol desaturase family protein [Kiloniellaceae bacterium]